MHGVPLALIEQQARMLDLTLDIIRIPQSETKDVYQSAICSYYKSLNDAGVDLVAFGDIFLNDLKQYRESLFDGCRIQPIFPLWSMNTKILVSDFLKCGFKAIICAADGSLFDKSTVGTVIDEHWIKQLPKGVDPCGENGEFHTFVFDGPGFQSPVHFKKGEKITKAYHFSSTHPDGRTENHTKEFWFQDLSLDID
jgi:uncharacterized protein (TIGR00290 family)